jgi:tetratricopeptide (TPR) repeat protein
VPSWWPGKPRALFLQGEAYNQAKLARKAEAAWLACALDDPLHPAPELYYLTAVEAVIEIFAMQERWEEAREVAWSCYDRVPPDQRKFVVFMILRTYVQRLAPDVRAKRLREFVAADPEDFESRLALARAEFGLGNTAEARSQVDECLALRPESARAWGTLLGMLKDLGDWEALAAEVAKVPASCDGDAEIMGFRGLAAERAGELKRAAELYGKEIELAPFSDEAHYRLALVQRRLGLKDEAARNLARSKELREAGGSLLGAYEAYSNARIAKVPDPELLRQTADRLAAVCRKLGWMRIADVL